MLQVGERVEFRLSATHPAATLVKQAQGEVCDVRDVNGTVFVDVVFPKEILPNNKGHKAEGVNETQLRKTADAPPVKLDIGSLVRALIAVGDQRPLEKRGAKHSAKDQGLMNTAHNAVADLCDKIHCANEVSAARKAELAKRGARHSKSTIDSLKKAHDALVQCGAICSMKKDDEEM